MLYLYHKNKKEKIFFSFFYSIIYIEKKLEYKKFLYRIIIKHKEKLIRI